MQGPRDVPLETHIEPPMGKPAIAQLVEHLTVDSRSNQMVPGSIPGGRIFFRHMVARGDFSLQVLVQLQMTPAGLEPAIPGSVGRCLIHWATGPINNGEMLRNSPNRFGSKRNLSAHGDCVAP